MSAMRLLEGEVNEPDERDAEIADLRDMVSGLRAALENTSRELAQAKRESAAALGALRKQLGPLYRALQAVFGELDAAGIEDVSHAAAANNPRTSAVWESWKARLGGGCAKVIDALLLHGDMNTQQLAIATGLHRTTIPKLIYSLNKAGLINKNGGRFSLKALS